MHAVCGKAAVEQPDGTKRPVKVVCPHGLRGTWSSVRIWLAEQAMAQAAPVSREQAIEETGRKLGHADHGRTAKRSYIGVPDHSEAVKVPELRVIAGGKAG